MSKKTLENNEVSLLIHTLDTIIALGIGDSKKRVMLKRDGSQPMTDASRDSLLRTDENDWVFPLETIELQKFKTKHDIDVPEAIIHTGPYADELARSINAVAVTLGSDVFFRNGSYNTATESGRAVLAHELTHIGQYEDQSIANGTSIEKLESEAESEEQKEYGIRNPVISVMAGNRIYRIRKSEMKEVAELSARKLSQWLEEQKLAMEPDEYLALLNR
ncbi:MAG: DUF4157 domain-containing protein, partial [Treponema sp.]|nr:DUF4157 domain-containing protein [Treponema sp.]